MKANITLIIDDGIAPPYMKFIRDAELTLNTTAGCVRGWTSGRDPAEYCQTGHYTLSLDLNWDDPAQVAQFKTFSATRAVEIADFKPTQEKVHDTGYFLGHEPKRWEKPMSPEDAKKLESLVEQVHRRAVEEPPLDQSPKATQEIQELVKKSHEVAGPPMLKPGPGGEGFGTTGEQPTCTHCSSSHSVTQAADCTCACHIPKQGSLVSGDALRYMSGHCDRCRGNGKTTDCGCSCHPTTPNPKWDKIEANSSAKQGLHAVGTVTGRLGSSEAGLNQRNCPACGTLSLVGQPCINCKAMLWSEPPVTLLSNAVTCKLRSILHQFVVQDMERTAARDLTLAILLRYLRQEQPNRGWTLSAKENDACVAFFDVEWEYLCRQYHRS